MGIIMHENVAYGGGSVVDPNPQESATEQLETLGIDGDVYAVTDADAIHTSDVGVANGIAELDSNGKVPASQLPSYVDDVLEYASRSAFPATGETGKIYVALDTNLTYRWSGSDYVEISPSLALGETSSTAYRGDRGKIAYDHSQSDHSGIKPAFTEASTRANIASGESFATLLGKIKKFFSDLKTVAFTGAYSDLSGTPTIPTVNNGTLTIQKNGTQVATFSANQSGNATANITVPTGDLASINKDGASSTKYLRGDGTWQNALELQGRVYESGDDEGLVIKPASNHWAGISLVNNTGRHTYFAMKDGQSDVPLWRFHDGSNMHDIIHPAKSGTIAVTSDIPAAVAVKGDKESTYRTGNVNLTPANIGATKYHGDLQDTLGSGTPAAATKTYYDSNVAVGGVETAYNSSGEEFTILFSKGSENYGNIIKYGYGNDYLWKLGKQNGNWLSDDWVKFKAGYADTAGSAPASDVSAWAKASTKPSYNFDEIGAGNVFVGDGGNYIKYRNAASWKAGIYYQTFGDEAAVFANENTRASWIFANVNVENRSQWNSLSPAMHIKNGKVAIGKLIANSAYLTYPLEVNGDVQATNFRGALVGNADTATQATKDGDGNTISSTYLKNSNVLMKNGDANVSPAGYRNIGGTNDYITLSEAGTYLITAWARFKGGTGNKAVLICRASDNAAYGQSWESSTINQSYPKTFTCFHVATVTSTTLYFRARVYTENTDVYGGISGGIYAIKVS